MKNLAMPVAMAIALLLLFGLGFAVRGWKDQSKPAENVLVGPTQVEVVVPERYGEHFRYRGLILDIDTGPDGNTAVNIGPQPLYRMGYVDGYNGYPKNPKYEDRLPYQRGYIEGHRAAREDKWP